MLNLRSVARMGVVAAVLLVGTACGTGPDLPAAAPSPAVATSVAGQSLSLPTAQLSSVPAARSDAAPTAASSDAAPTATSAEQPTPANPPAATAPQAGLAAPPSGPVLSVSAPVALSVPAIGIESPLIELGRNADGTVEVPSLDDPDSKPGWYRNSPTPGALGPAIILGHVDSRQFGPGIFYALQDLSPGDSIDISRADGTVAEFVVDSVESVQKSDFPTLEVYGNLDHSGLRLITCGGEFDPAAQSYESNIIVFASLAGSRAA